MGGEHVPFVDPWFWAFLAAIGWGLAVGAVGAQIPGRSLRFGVPVVMLAEVPRVLLLLPFVSQPRLGAGRPVLAAVGVAVLAGSLLFATPVVRILRSPGRLALSRGAPMGSAPVSATRSCCAMSSGRLACRSSSDRSSASRSPRCGCWWSGS